MTKSDNELIAELQKEVERLTLVADVAAQCTIDLNSNLSSAHKEYMAGELAAGAYNYVLMRHGRIFEALHNAGYTDRHPLFETPIKPKAQH
jgi:hypothetical protein